MQWLLPDSLQNPSMIHHLEEWVMWSEFAHREIKAQRVIWTVGLTSASWSVADMDKETSSSTWGRRSLPVETHTSRVSPAISSVQLLSCVQLFVTPLAAPCQASLFITNSQSLLKPMSIELVMPSNHLILCHPLYVKHKITSIKYIYSSGTATFFLLRITYLLYK